MKEQDIKELVDIIKESGVYSAELDGYVVNPTTIACKLLPIIHGCKDENGNDGRGLRTVCEERIRQEERERIKDIINQYDITGVSNSVLLAKKFILQALKQQEGK